MNNTEIVQLRKFIVEHYNLEEAKTLCFDLGVRYDDLGGEGISAKVRDLLLYLGRQSRLEDLLTILRDTRAVTYKSHAFLLDSALADKMYKQLDSLELEKIEPRISELIEILEFRASTILEQLSQHYKYVEVKKYTQQFMSLHSKHIDALRKGNLILAHEVLQSINKLSYDIESDEFWTRYRLEAPGTLYSLRGDAFRRGIIITGYLSGELARYSSLYSEDLFANQQFSSPEADPSDSSRAQAYEKVLQTGT